MRTSVIRRRVLAGLLLSASVTGLTATASVAPAQAATTHSHAELSTEHPVLGKLVLTARGTREGSAVGVAFDNNSSLAQWDFVSINGAFKKGMYVLRHTENTSRPMCLSAAWGSVNISDCWVGNPAQRWTLTSGHSLMNDFGLAIQKPANPVLASNLTTGPQFGSQSWTRLFVQD